MLLKWLPLSLPPTFFFFQRNIIINFITRTLVSWLLSIYLSIATWFWCFFFYHLNILQFSFWPWNREFVALDRQHHLYHFPRQHIKKQRYYFANKGLSSHSYGCSSSHVWMWELDHKESWVPKNWCFWTIVLKTLESPLDSKEIKFLSILKEINPEYSLGLMLKLKLQYFGHPMWRTDLMEKTLKLGKFEGGRRRGRQRMRWDGWMASLTRWTWVRASSGSWWWAGRAGVLQSMGLQRVGHD